jgi:hypothetical protein
MLGGSIPSIHISAAERQLLGNVDQLVNGRNVGVDRHAPNTALDIYNQIGYTPRRRARDGGRPSLFSLSAQATGALEGAASLRRDEGSGGDITPMTAALSRARVASCLRARAELERSRSVNLRPSHSQIEARKSPRRQREARRSHRQFLAGEVPAQIQHFGSREAAKAQRGCVWRKSLPVCVRCRRRKSGFAAGARPYRHSTSNDWFSFFSVMLIFISMTATRRGTLRSSAEGRSILLLGVFAASRENPFSLNHAEAPQAGPTSPSSPRPASPSRAATAPGR